MSPTWLLDGKSWTAQESDANTWVWPLGRGKGKNRLVHFVMLPFNSLETLIYTKDPSSLAANPNRRLTDVEAVWSMKGEKEVELDQRRKEGRGKERIWEQTDVDQIRRSLWNGSRDVAGLFLLHVHCSAPHTMFRNSEFGFVLACRGHWRPAGRQWRPCARSQDREQLSVWLHTGTWTSTVQPAHKQVGWFLLLRAVTTLIHRSHKTKFPHIWCHFIYMKFRF